MARVAARSGWIGLLAHQRGPFRIYQWLWLVLCTVGALAVTAPRILSQPVIYQTDSEVRFDTTRYGGIYDEVAPSRTALNIAIDDATTALRQRFFAQGELRFGLPNYLVQFEPTEAGVVRIHGIAPTAQEAQSLANSGAEELVRQIRAAGGREVLRNLLGWELVAALRGEPISSEFQADLRLIIERDAFPLSRQIEPVSQRIRVEDLPNEEQNDLARALESRYDLWTFEISSRDTTIDTLCGTANLLDETARRAQIDTCVAANPAAAFELDARERAVERRQAIDETLRYMRSQLPVTFTPDAAGPVQRLVAALPSAPVDRRIPLLLGLATFFGLAFGVAGVAVDRSAGVMEKIRELWGYRELIRNLVLRDLRVRYKGSVLGYLWTQLAPLLMMLVFVIVFALLLPSGIAMYPVFVVIGLLSWNFCAEAVTGGTRSILDNASVIKKVFFPREVLPLVSVFSSLVNFLFSLPMMFLVIIIVQLFYPPLQAQGRLNLSWTIAYLPVLIVLQTILLAGIAMFLSALAVVFRDIVHLIGILIQFWFFLTPVVYSLDTLTLTEWQTRLIRWLNPMASLIEFYREIFYGTAVPVGQIPTPGLPALASVLRVSVTAVVVLAFGYWFFQRRSGRFGEEI